jgi:hypothetical protein
MQPTRARTATSFLESRELFAYIHALHRLSNSNCRASNYAGTVPTERLYG